MGVMNVEQAVFASSDRGRIKGYQVVAHSSGIDRAMIQELCRWAPTQIPSDDPKDWTINYFPILSDAIAVTRTVLGGPEYSGRGGTQVVTLILVLSDEQFMAYGYNPIEVAGAAMAMGYLRLPVDPDNEALPQAVLPSRPIVELNIENYIGERDEKLLDQVTVLVKEMHRVAVVGFQDPIEAVRRIVPKLSVEARRQFSFTTGLTPTVRRPFQLHFLPSADLTRQRTLDAQDIVRIDAS